MELKNQTAVVTGAAEGIGKGIVLALAERKVRTICLDIQDSKNLETSAKAGTISSSGSSWYHCDIGDAEEIDRVFDRIYEEEGRVDILVNNAGVFSTMSFVESSYAEAIEHFSYNMNINARGTMLCAKKVAPHMASAGRGQILNVITNHMKRAFFPPSSSEHAYDASKWAQFGFNESMDVELKPYGIRVNAICPAATRSRMLEDFFDSIHVPLNKENMGKVSGIASLLEAEEVGEAACHILEWDEDQPTGRAYLLMYSEDCEKLRNGHADDLTIDVAKA